MTEDGSAPDPVLSFGDAGAWLEESGFDVALVDAEILRLYRNLLSGLRVIELPAGGLSKSVETLVETWKRFRELGIDRSSRAIVVGGGSATDVGGFACATWMRGIHFSLLPTTLLAMVDASSGGKNGIDLPGGKNVVGTFAWPDSTRIDLSFLRTLPGSELSAGMAEALKHGIIEGGRYWDLVVSAGPGDFSDGSAARAEEIVRGSVRIKRAIADSDPRERGRRRVLNLGHTFGHAIETATGLSHGRAVAAGMALACAFAERRFGARDGERIVEALSAWGLPVGMEEAARESGLPAADGSFRERVAGLLAADKKKEGGMIAFVCPRAIGEVTVERVALGELESFARVAR